MSYKLFTYPHSELKLWKRYNVLLKILIFSFLTPLNLPKGETYGQQSIPYSPLRLLSEAEARGWGRSGLGEVKREKY